MTAEANKLKEWSERIEAKTTIKRNVRGRVFLVFMALRLKVSEIFLPDLQEDRPDVRMSKYSLDMDAYCIKIWIYLDC